MTKLHLRGSLADMPQVTKKKPDGCGTSECLRMKDLARVIETNVWMRFDLYIHSFDTYESGTDGNWETTLRGKNEAITWSQPSNPYRDERNRDRGKKRVGCW